MMPYIYRHYNGYDTSKFKVRGDGSAEFAGTVIMSDSLAAFPKTVM